MAVPNSGSHWHRWEPHIHAPGTVLNDQFKGSDKWETYLGALEVATPQIRAIGVTDYYSTDTYEQVVESKRSGRLPNCDLIFPNIEMRLGIGTVKGRWVNVHLLVCPDDPNHLAELKRFLARLTFKAHEDSYACTKDDLIQLGQRSRPELTDPTAALEHGSEQFKVSFDQLRENYVQSAWAQENILIGVAGSETNGTSGVRESADATLRQEVEKFAHVIFASSSAQRDFWLGRKTLNEEQIRERYGDIKPCMHGSDAHEHRRIGVPDGDRYSWIKGAVAFDTLRQANIDPVGRAYVGDTTPIAATPSQVIKAVHIHDAPWVQTPVVELNPGLVAIIGARGSGKTALADIIARGCDATSVGLSPTSFLTRANTLLEGSSVTLGWQDGDDSQRYLDDTEEISWDDVPRARYLSQQFVEELCSAQGMTDTLMSEIERVIFESHSLGDRDGAINFEELRDMRVTRFREARAREESTLTDLSERIGIELEKTKVVAGLKKQIAEKEKVIKGYERDRAKLITKGSEVRVARLAALTAAAEKVRGYVRTFATREQNLEVLQDEVKNFRAHQAPETLRRSQERYSATNLKGDEWDPFLLDYTGDVDTTLTTHLKKARDSQKSWKGIGMEAADPNTPLLSDDAELEKQNLALLEAEIGRIEKLVGADREMTVKFSALSKRIAEESVALERLKERLTDCEGAKERIKLLAQEREAAYVRVFQAVVAEEIVLVELYSPLMKRLDAAGGTLKKLAFSVRREADVAKWADDGEKLLDLRFQGSFKGRGTLRQIADATLKGDWETGIRRR